MRPWGWVVGKEPGHPVRMSDARHAGEGVLGWAHTFRWPSPGRSEDDTTKVRLSAAALAMLLGGLDPAGVRLRSWMRLNE